MGIHLHSVNRSGTEEAIIYRESDYVWALTTLPNVALTVHMLYRPITLSALDD
jgi:hypothetical protein